jgi:hypothetical protein
MNIMNSKLILSGVLAVVLLSGCAATVIEAPKSAEELSSLDDSNLLNVPVDISGFYAYKKDIYSEKIDGVRISRDGDRGRITIFSDPVTGKNYDEDGQPVNEKGQRILRNGYVCKVALINNNIRIYRDNTWTVEPETQACKTRRMGEFQNNNRVASLTGLALGGVVGLVITSVGSVSVQQITAEDTF